MKLNKDRHIGRVLFIVEGSRTEFSILRRIFCNLLGYSYIEKRRNRPICFASTNDCFSKVGVINTRESNIRDISENETYLDDVFDVLREQYQFPVDQSAIYYLFDRDPKSNTDSALIEKYILSLANPYDISVNRHLSQVRAVSLRREFFHLLVNEAFFFLRDPEFHLYVPFSVRHKTPPFFIRVWDYPNKQNPQVGTHLLCLLS